MSSANKPWWAQATPLVSVSASGALIGFSFVPGTAAGLTSPAGLPHLAALDKIVHTPDPAGPAHADAARADQSLRSAVVNVAKYYLRMARTKTPAQMEAIIWGVDSVNGADHGESCAAFASMTLELGAQSAGQQSWVSGGGSYPWPLHEWADVRVDPNPDSLGVTSIMQDAKANGRWHPLDDGYTPRPGDWVMFDQHVEVVTGYADGVLSTIGADSLPGLTVNAHEFSGSLAEHGVAGFVDNGGLAATADSGTAPAGSGEAAHGGSAKAAPAAKGRPAASAAAKGADIPGAVAQVLPKAGLASVPGAAAPAPAAPAASARAQHTAPAHAPYGRHQPDAGSAAVPETATQQAFISSVAPGAMAAQARFGIPAAVTIAQAIDESGWGRSDLAVRDHNLFGIKGSGPAGTDALPTKEFRDGEWVTTTAHFRVYHNVAQSIADHGQLLATTPSYQRAMADRSVPDAFANDLTGVYATDPQYGSTLIALMRLYDLYRYDDLSAAATATSPAVAAPPPVHAPVHAPVSPPVHAAVHPSAAPSVHPPAAAIPGLLAPAAATPTPAAAAPSAHPPAAVPAGPAAPSAHAMAASAIPGLSVHPPAAAAPSAHPPSARGPAAAPAFPAASARVPGVAATSAGQARATRGRARVPGLTAAVTAAPRYHAQIPAAVTTAFINTARASIMTAKPLYSDVSSFTGISWQLLAACDWMQCGGRTRYSPVHGERLGAVNADGTVYYTKSEALAQCAADLIELSRSVYRIRLQGRKQLSVTDLANAFAAFRWGGLLRQHNVSAMEFPYSVQGLTAQQTKMRWPKIPAPDAPDRPGTRFRSPFGAVPIVLSLNYPATA